MSDPDLLLHLPMDEIHGDKFHDDVDAGRNAINHGGAIVEDRDFGQCLEFKGSGNPYVQLPSLKQATAGLHGLTVMLWLKPAVENAYLSLLELDHLYGFDGKALGFSFCKVSNRELIAGVYETDFKGGSFRPYHLVDDRLQKVTPEWIHLTFVKDQNRQEFYLNGLPFSTYQGKVMGATTTIPALGGGAIPLNQIPLAPETSHLGLSTFTYFPLVGRPFVGRVAQLRFYKRALTRDEINWDMEGDRAVQYRYRITHPIDFSLENRDADPTLFMDGHPEGQTMFLRVNNVTGGVIKLEPPPLPKDDASETNCHFELAFRPGALETGSAAKVTLVKPSSGWKIASKSWQAPDDRDSIYLLCTQSGPLPDGGLYLELGHVLPDSRFGTRTTLVDFRYKNLTSGAGEKISGSVQQNLDLVNHLGRRNIPLHVGFAGSNLVQNNSAHATELKLRVTNVLPRTGPYDQPQNTAGTGNLRFNDKSEFLLSFDERPGTAWALNAPDKIKDFIVRYAKGRVSKESPDKAERIDGTALKPYQWKIPLKGLFLGPEEHLEILIENVKATGSDGHSNLYLDYRDVPGYWNGRFTTVIEKAPLVYRKGKVGIEVEPETELHVKGALKVDSLIVGSQTLNKPIPIDLTEGWTPSRTLGPKCFKDAQGTVHLFGFCQRRLPGDLNGKMSILGKRVFTLLTSFAPNPEISHRHIFPARVLYAQASGGPIGHYYGGLRLESDGSCYVSLEFLDVPYDLIKLVYPQELKDVEVNVFVYLDGISYLAKS